jgi:hypothetical protein
MSRTRKRQNLGWYLVASVLVSGMIRFFIYEDIGRSAWPSAFEKAYLWTATFFGLLFYAYWRSTRRSWFWKALVPIVPAHVVVALVVIKFILASSPGINQYPGSIYGGLLSSIYGEWLVSNRIIYGAISRVAHPSDTAKGGAASAWVIPKIYRTEWCRRRDSNPHTLAGTWT